MATNTTIWCIEKRTWLDNIITFGLGLIFREKYTNLDLTTSQKYTIF